MPDISDKKKTRNILDVYGEISNGQTGESSDAEFSALANRYGSDQLVWDKPRTILDFERDHLARIGEGGIDQAPKRTIGGTAKDVGVAALKGAIGVPEAAVGLADIVSGGRAGKFAAEKLQFRPKEAKEILSGFYSPAQKEAQRKVSEASGFTDTVLTSLENPSTIAETVIESLPSMGAGGVVGRGFSAATKAAPWLAGAVGEGVVGAGQSAEGIRQESKTGELSAKQAASAAASGAFTGLINAIGGRMAKKFGFEDVDTLLAGGTRGTKGKSVGEIASGILKGGISEGVFEELPQSAQEQIWQNVALDRPILEDVEESAAQGLLAGAAMGGSANISLPQKKGPSPGLQKNQAILEIKKANLPTRDLIALRNDPEGLVQAGLSPDDIDLVLNERYQELEEERSFINENDGPISRAAGQSIRQAQAEMILNRERERNVIQEAMDRRTMDQEMAGYQPEPPWPSRASQAQSFTGTAYADTDRLPNDNLMQGEWERQQRAAMAYNKARNMKESELTPEMRAFMAAYEKGNESASEYPGGPPVQPDYSEIEKEWKRKEAEMRWQRAKKSMESADEVLSDKKIPPTVIRDAKKKAEEIISSDPVYAHMAEARKRGGLSLKDLKKDYDSATIRQINRRYPGIFSRNGKVKPDEFASEMGYADLRGMIDRFIEAKTKKELQASIVQQLHDEWLNAENGWEEFKKGSQRKENRLAKFRQFAPESGKPETVHLKGGYPESEETISAIENYIRKTPATVTSDMLDSWTFTSAQKARLRKAYREAIAGLMGTQAAIADPGSSMRGDSQVGQRMSAGEFMGRTGPVTVHPDIRPAAGEMMGQQVATVEQKGKPQEGEAESVKTEKEQQERQASSQEEEAGALRKSQEAYPDLTLSGQRKNFPGNDDLYYAIHKKAGADYYTVTIGHNTDTRVARIYGHGDTPEAAYDSAIMQMRSTRRAQSGTETHAGHSFQPQKQPKTGTGQPGAAGVKDEYYGASNKLVSRERAEEVRKRLREKLNQLNAGIDPELLSLGMELAAFHIEAGSRKFSEYAKVMIEELSEAVKPYLRSFYEGARHLPGLDNSEMSTPEEIDSYFSSDSIAPEPGVEDHGRDTNGVVDTDSSSDETQIVTEEQFRNDLERKGVAVDADGRTFKILKSDTPDTYYYQVTEDGFRIDKGPGGPQSWSIEYAIDRAVQEAFPEQMESGQAGTKVDPGGIIAGQVKGALKAGKKITWQQLFKWADEAYDGTQAQGKYTPKDAYDALELGVNQYLLDESGLRFNPSDTTVPEIYIDSLNREVMSMIPTQSKRTWETDEYQQFSTPPPLAFMANWVAKPQKGEVYLEPSAGIGGLAVFGKNAGAVVVVNELSDRRRNLIEQMGFDRVTGENAEHLNSILPKDIKPTVIVMNPPFSATAGRIKGKRSTKIGAKHIEQALKRLQPGGRLVAIVGEGMGPNKPAFREWWYTISKEYNVRANIDVSGKGYRKYGTTFDNQLIVIDKTGPTTEDIITGKVEHPVELVNLLKEVRNDRAAVQQKQDSQDSQAYPEETAGQGPGEVPVAGDVVSTVSDEMGTGGEGTGNAQTQRDLQGHAGGAPGGRGPGKNQEVRDELATGRQETRGTVADNANQQEDDTGGSGMGAASNPGRRDNRDRGLGGHRGEEVDGQSTAEAVPRDVDEVAVSVVENSDYANIELSDSVYEEYRPEKIRIKGARKHPAPLVQSAAMASVSAPDTSYFPTIPKKTIESGALSEVQLEAIVYAGNAHSKKLPSGERQGFFIGDGTGVGKGREAAGILFDNWNKGRRKAVWITEKQGLLKDAKRDVKGIGWDHDVLISHAKVKSGSDIKHSNGVLFTTYDRLKQKGSGDNKKSRIEQIVEWLGPDFDGVIVFDEAHNMSNSTTQKGKRGNKGPSQKALAGVDLQKALPNARVVYLSATGATEVHNLAYAERLGLWGDGTAFPSKENFIANVSAGGTAAMEMVARDMKAMGVYLARSISYHGVEYDRLEHTLTPEQRKAYDKVASAWQIVLANFNEALDVTDAQGRDRGRAIGQFWGANQRFFNQFITTLQMPSALAEMRKDIERGESVVVQIDNTFEAATDRALTKMAEEGGTIEDLDISPFDDLMLLVEKSFPVVQYEEYEDEDGNIRTRQVVDSNGDPVLNAEAVGMRERLLDELGAMRGLVANNPLDQIIDEFGVDTVAEVTGRRRRVVWVEDENGIKKRVVQKRTPSSKKADIDAFQNREKRILIFSQAGGTGASYHADLTAKNQSKRNHYVLQPGWEADKAVQGLGRTHRSNQKQPPKFRLVTTDLKGQKRFLSSIARRLEQLGALTKGQRQTGNQGIFSERDNLESPYARDALRMLFDDLVHNRVEGITIEDFEEQTSLKIIDEETRSLKESDLPGITQFLNRLLSMNIDDQNAMFDAFSERLDRVIAAHAKAGTLDVGMETLVADSVKKVSDTVVNRDKRTGAETRYVVLDVETPAPRLEFASSRQYAKHGYYRNKTSGMIWAVTRRFKTNRKTGDVVEIYSLTSPSYRRQTIPVSEFSDKRWEKIDSGSAKDEWNRKLDELPKTVTKNEHLITGALLPVWDKLHGHARVMRVQTDSGERMLGRIIPEKNLDATLGALGVDAEGRKTTIEMQPGEILSSVLDNGDTVTLADGTRIVRGFVSGENRVEVKGLSYGQAEALKKHGLFSERISFKTRYFIPASKDGVTVIEKMTERNPVTSISGSQGGLSDDVRFSRKISSYHTSIASLTGKEIEGYSGETLFEKARDYFRRNLQGNSVYRPEIGNVRITNKGWNKFKRGLRIDDLKARIIPAIPSIIEDGTYHGRNEESSRTDDIVAFHYFDGYIDVAGEKVQVGLTVAEDSRGNLFYNLNHDADKLWEKRKARHEPRIEAEGGEPSFGDFSPSKYSISSERLPVNIVILNRRNEPVSTLPPSSQANIREELGRKIARPLERKGVLRIVTPEEADMLLSVARSVKKYEMLWNAAQSRSVSPGGKPAFARETLAKSGELTPNAKQTNISSLKIGQKEPDVKKSTDGSRVEGFTLNGKIYLVQGNIAKGQAMGVLLHELGVHLRRLGFKDSKQFQRVLNMVQRRAKKDTEEGRAIRDAMARVPADTKPEHVAEETLAYLVSHGRTDIGVVRRFLAAVKKFLVEKLGFTPRILNNLDLQALAVNVLRREVSRGTDKEYLSVGGGSFMASMAESLGVTRKQLQREYDAVVKRYRGTAQWMKAPNGENSNLPEHLWVLVRTPRFKAWFGNWEMDRSKEIPVEVIAVRMFGGDRKKAIAWLLEERNGIIGTHRNDETGMDIAVSRKVIKKKATSGKAVVKSMTNDHYEILRALPALISNASMAAAEPDSNRSADVVGVYKFVAPVRVGEKTYSVKLTVKDYVPGQGKRHGYYTHELIDIDMPNHPAMSGTGGAGPSITRSGMSSASSREARIPDHQGIRSTYRVGELVDVVNRKQPGAIPEPSKVVDENGEPAVLFHGTDYDFEAFDIQRSGGEPAMFFSPDPGIASAYAGSRDFLFPPENGPNVIPVFLAIKNPLVVDFKGEESYDFDDEIWQAMEDGHDGVILENVKDSDKVPETQYAVFSPTQIKSIYNRGSFDPQDDRIRYSVATDATDGKDSRARTPPEPFSPEVASMLRSVLGDAKMDAIEDIRREGLNVKNETKYWSAVAGEQEVDQNDPEKIKAWLKSLPRATARKSLGALTLRQLRDIYGKEVPQVEDFYQATRAIAADTNQIMREADSVYNQWAKLDRKISDKLADIMTKATVAGVHPDRDFEPKADIKKLRGAMDKSARRLIEIEEKIKSGSATDAEMAEKEKLARNIERQAERIENERKRFLAHKRLSKAYDALPQDAKDVYHAVRGMYDKNLLRVFEAILDRIERTIGDKKMRKITMDMVRMRFDQFIKEGPYFPLARFGDYIAIATKDGKREVHTFETMAERDRFVARRRKNGWQVKTRTKKDYSPQVEGASTAFVEGIVNIIARSDIGSADKQALIDEVNQHFIKSMPDLSHRKHFVHRKKVAGHSRDQMRAFAANMQHAAHHIARIRHADKMTAAIHGIDQEAQLAGHDEDATAYTDLFNELSKRLEQITNPQISPVAQAATSIGFLWNIGPSIASATVNLTQTPLVAYPMMAARFKAWKSSAVELNRAAADYLTSPWEMETGFNAAKNDKLSAKERDMLNTLIQDGTIDVTQAHELAQAASQDYLNFISKNKYGHQLMKTMRIVSYPFHVAEIANRQITALAAYRVALKKGMNHTDAVTAARELVLDAHFDYSQTNRARLMEGKWRRVVLLFKQYSQQMTYLIGRSFYLAAKGESQEVKETARNQLLGILAGHFMLAGTLGMPVAGSVMEILQFLVNAFGDDDDDWDWEVWYRNMLADAFGKAGGEAIARGPWRLLPFLGDLDLSSRVSLGDLWFRAPNREAEGRDKFNQWMNLILGPLASNAGSAVQGMYAIAEGHTWKGIELMVPKVLKDAMKGIRYAREGVTSWKDDTLIEDMRVAEIIGQTIGFTPSRVNEMYEAKNAIMNAEYRIDRRRKIMINRWVQAVRKHDAKKAEAITREIMKFNEKNPLFRITRKSLQRSYAYRMRYQAHTKDGVYLPATKEKMREIGRFANI